MAKRPTAPPAPTTVWVEDVERIRVGVHARRQDIVDRLAAFGPLSVRRLATLLGAKPSALYHHLKLLLDAGLVVEAGFDVNRRKREQLYGTPARSVRVRLRPEDPANREVVESFARALGRQIERDLSVGQTATVARAQGEGRNLALRRVCGRPDAATLREVNALLERVGDLLSAGGASTGDAVVLTWTLAPLPDHRAVADDA